MLDFAKFLSTLTYGTLSYISDLFKFLIAKFSLGLPLLFISGTFSFVYYTIYYPENFINGLLILLFSNWVEPLLFKTPPDLKIAFLLNKFYLIVPYGLESIVSEISSGALGMLGLYLSFRMIKILPFFK